MLPLVVAGRVYRLLPPRQRREAVWLMPLMILRAAIETVGVASIMPFMAVVADPIGALGNRYLQLAFDTLGFTSTGDFITFLGGAAIVLLVFSSTLTVLSAYQARRFAMGLRHLYQVQLMANNLAKPYSAFASINTADLGETIITEVAEVIDGVITPLLLLASRFVAALAVLLLLITVNPYMALVTGTVLGGAYYLIFLVVQVRLRRLGLERTVVDRKRYRSITEAFSGIKAVKTSGKERAYLGEFSAATKRSTELSVEQHVVNIIPKSVLEALAFGAVIGVVLILMRTSSSTAVALSTITLYAFAFYRLLPATQQMYESFTQIRYSLPALDVLEQSLENGASNLPDFSSARPSGLREGIELDNVDFYYPGMMEPSLEGVSLHIRRNTSVALVGTTGSGKTTVIDLILGLYRPTQGSIRVDGRELSDETARSWQATIGYVPQQVFLKDGSIAENIAFGEDEHADLEAVEAAAKIAQIHEFIMTLPEGYRSQVGERGIRLSGGQIQRLGIARALYRRPDVLVLDEATNALDNLTESAVFDALSKLLGQITVIMVAHRLSTVKTCDTIYQMENGRLIASGTFEHLISTNSTFRTLANSSLDSRPAGVPRDRPSDYPKVRSLH